MKWITSKLLPVFAIVSILLASCATPPPVVVVVPVVPSATAASSNTPGGTTVVPAASPTNLPPLTDDVWDRIVANGKIVVGTSWDYPPFASVNSNFEVVGLDMALMQEIGRRLKIPIEFQNFTFDGLNGALHINQIDLAIAAISITPERASQVTFSPVYYVNQTAVLAKNDSTVRITDFKQLAGYRVGVQRGTTYEIMAQTELVDTGLMGSEKLMRYSQADEAIRDLLENRVDLVVIGQATASFYSTQKHLLVVGSDFGQQDLALAMRLGTPRLKAEIDRVMDAMLTDGTILALIQEYNQNDVVKAFPTLRPQSQPTATAVPPVATATPLACVDGMKFVSDVTFGDNAMKSAPYIKPGVEFVKVWRVQNTGTCTWTPQYRLAYAYGNFIGAQMNGQPVYIPGNIVYGQVIDLSVTMIAPQTPATYQGFWQIENASGRRFGQTIWVGISTLSDLDKPISTEQPPVTGNFCQVSLKSPKTPIPASGSFDAIWTVKNISRSDWAMDSVDYKFISGTEMHEKSVYDFSQTIKNSESGDIIVDMTAPPTPGIYNTRWAIVAGTKTFCFLDLSLTVVSK